MQQLRLFFAMALLYMFRVTIPPIINTQHSEKQHGITRQCYLQLNTTDNDKTTRILTILQHKYTCLPERPYTALYSWWWLELSPETCRVKPPRRINAIVASCWNYFTNKVWFNTACSECSCIFKPLDIQMTVMASPHKVRLVDHLHLQRHVWQV